jgi:hypothetical protein
MTIDNADNFEFSSAAEYATTAFADVRMEAFAAQPTPAQSRAYNGSELTSVLDLTSPIYGVETQQAQAQDSAPQTNDALPNGVTQEQVTQMVAGIRNGEWNRESHAAIESILRQCNNPQAVADGLNALARSVNRELAGQNPPTDFRVTIPPVVVTGDGTLVGSAVINRPNETVVPGSRVLSIRLTPNASSGVTA